jgi:hypothetical protein
MELPELGCERRGEGLRKVQGGSTVQRVSLQDLVNPDDGGATFMLSYRLQVTRDIRIGFVGLMLCSDQEGQCRVRNTQWNCLENFGLETKMK